MERCANTEALNRYLDEQDRLEERDRFLKEKILEVEEKFFDLAQEEGGMKSGMTSAFDWLGGECSAHLIASTICHLFGDNSNLAFEKAVEAKAEELLEADCAEPDAPDY